MRTEDQLRRAADGMERVTASLTAPPIDEVRRSARRRGIGVALAAAVGVAVLVGGVVLALSPGGETTLGPAAPGEATSTTAGPGSYPSEVDGVPVRTPNPDAEPEWDIYSEATAVPFAVPVTSESDIRSAMSNLADEFSGVPQEVLILGRSESYRSYLFLGEFAPRNPAREEGTTYPMCIYAQSETSAMFTCFPDGADPHDVVDPEPEGAGAVFGVVGLSVPGSSTVVLDIGGSKAWARTREGTVNIFGRGTMESAVEYTIYDAAGNPLRTDVIWDEERAGRFDGSQTTTTATAAEGDGSCSGEGGAPAALALSSIPQPVAQTLQSIVDAARRCDFDALESVAGDNFTASYGGDDPSGLWTMQEEQGDQPMYALLEILDMPYGTIDTENGTLFVWPSAYANQGDWSTVPAEDIEALRAYYTEDEIQQFAEFGGYFGYRVGIWETGDWSFYVAGD